MCLDDLSHAFDNNYSGFRELQRPHGMVDEFAAKRLFKCRDGARHNRRINVKGLRGSRETAGFGKHQKGAPGAEIVELGHDRPSLTGFMVRYRRL